MNKDLLLKLANRGLSLNGDPNRGYFESERGSLYQDPTASHVVDIDVANREFLRTLATAPTDISPNPSDPEDVRAAKASTMELLKSALRGNEKALRSLNAIRTEQVDNFVKAQSSYMSFFDIVTLKDNEQPWVQNETQNEIRVGYIGENGSPRLQKIEKAQDQYSIALRIISSAKVGYRTQDIYNGQIGTIAQRTFDIAFDVAQKVDSECFGLMTAALSKGGAFGAFAFTETNKANRIYVPNSYLRSEHLPSTNDITVYKRNSDGNYINSSGAVTTTPSEYVIVGRFGIEVIQEILGYTTSWGNIFSDGPLVPTGEIIVPASDIKTIMYQMAYAANSNSSDLQEQVNKTGFFGFRYMNVDWKFIPDLTIPVGTCFPKFNKSAGRVFLKPSQDEEFVKTDNERHWETRSQQKVFGACIINQKRMNLLRLKYKN